MNKHITSLQNPLVKEWISIKEKSRSRKRTGLFLIEGKREIEMARKGGYSFTTIICNSELISANEINSFKTTNAEIIEVSEEVYNRLAYRETTQGVLAVAKVKELTLDRLMIENPNPLILVTEAPEKPGNIGALLRTADAAKLDAVIIANPKTDMYNPNIIRSSIGCLFTNNIATGTSSEIIDFLQQKKINIFCAALQKSVEYHKQDYTKPTAIVVGTESTGLTDQWLQNSNQNILIPMQGEIDSLNVSVAAGIVIFEAKRQRSFI